MGLRTLSGRHFQELLQPPLEITWNCNLHTFSQRIAQVWHLSCEEPPLLFNLRPPSWKAKGTDNPSEQSSYCWSFIVFYPTSPVWVLTRWDTSKILRRKGTNQIILVCVCVFSHAHPYTSVNSPGIFKLQEARWRNLDEHAGACPVWENCFKIHRPATLIPLNCDWGMIIPFRTKRGKH